MTFALPGRIWAVVIPAFSAASRPPSSAFALMASIALICGVAGSVISFPSLPAQPMVSSQMPMWQWASTRPGITTFPDASMTSASFGTFTSTPTSTILPSSMRIVPSSIVPLVMVRILPSLMANIQLTFQRLWIRRIKYWLESVPELTVSFGPNMQKSGLFY